MEFDCPVCHTQLAVQGNSARCERCAKEYVVEARCRTATSRWRC